MADPTRALPDGGAQRSLREPQQSSHVVQGRAPLAQGGCGDAQGRLMARTRRESVSPRRFLVGRSSVTLHPMSIDPNKIPKSRRLTLIRLGEQFGSQDTLDQANQTLAAYDKHAALLKTSGFGAKHAAELTDARNGLVDAGVGREMAKGKKKVTGEAYIQAFAQGTTARFQARAVLAGVKEDLEASEAAGSPEALAAVATVLRQTRAAARNAEPLAQQLTLLLDALTGELVATTAADQGGPEVKADLSASITALRKADQEDVGVRGTPVETETLDLLDGIIIQQVRRARRAALAASRRLGNPALVEAFKLDKLYRSRGSAPAEEDDADDVEDVKGKDAATP